MKHRSHIGLCVALAAAGTLSIGAAGGAAAAVMAFDHTDFTRTPVFNDLRDFAFRVELDGPIVAGAVADDPALLGVEYSVYGLLTSATPSGFPAFDLKRTIGGAEFYSQGSSLRFEVAAGADLTDGLQAAELVADGEGKVFVFNGREISTGRYHPSLLELFADGTGRIQNSNNTGGVNPGNGQVVDVDFGQEYIVDLAFDPAALTLVSATEIPEPGTATAVAVALGVLAWPRRRRVPVDGG